MSTEASLQALEGLRDLSTLKWYVIPLLAIVLYIYTIEIKKARESGNWNVVYSGLALFGMDFINETWNGWVYHLTQHSAFWTTPGETALRIMMGWNVEIVFMFFISGIVFANALPEDKNAKILGIPNRWALAIGFSVFCVFVEVLLNIGGLLVWEYPFWNASFTGIWLIFFLGYFHFYVVTFWVHDMRDNKNKLKVLGIIYGFAIIANIVCLGILGWVY